MEMVLMWLMLLLPGYNASIKQFSRIAGGKKAKLGDFPFFAQIIVALDDEGEMASSCGGSLISPEWIITAAHCIPGNSTDIDELLKLKRITTIMGTVKKSDPYGILNMAVKAHIHPKFHVEYAEGEGVLKRVDNDVGILKLVRPYDISKTVQVAHLPFQTQSSHKTTRCKNGTIIGMGYTELGVSSDHLVFANIFSFRRTELHTPIEKPVVDSVFYTEVKFTQGHSMPGDSGGPFICRKTKNNKKYFVLYGIDSHGFSGVEDLKVTIYEAVDSQMNFILKYVRDANLYGRRNLESSEERLGMIDGDLEEGQFYHELRGDKCNSITPSLLTIFACTILIM